MNKQVKTGKQPIPPMNPKTETSKKDQTFSQREKDKGQDSQEEIQRQKGNTDTDLEEKKFTGSKTQGNDKGQSTELPGTKQQDQKRTTQQEDRDRDDDEQIEDETESDETEDTDDNRNQTDPQI